MWRRCRRTGQAVLESASMTAEDLRQEINREPFTPFRLHLSSGKVVDVRYPHSAWLRQNTLLLLERLEPGSPDIGGYDVIAYRLIERIELIGGSPRSSRRNGAKRKKKGS